MRDGGHETRRGFVHVDPTVAPDGRIIAEVYPHAAMVALWDLPKTIKYKNSVDERRAGLDVLRAHLRQLRTAEPPLLRSGVLSEELAVDLDRLSGKLTDLLPGASRAATNFPKWNIQPACGAGESVKPGA